MSRAILTLQYPDPLLGRSKILAATYNPKALVAFKEAVLEDARLEALGWGQDELLDCLAEKELEKLELIFNKLQSQMEDNTILQV